MAFAIPMVATAALNAGMISVGTATAIGAAAPVIGALGTGLSVLGSIKQGQAAKSSAKYNSQIQQQNAKIAQQKAQMAGEEGAAKAAAEGLKTRAQVGAIKAAQAANGVDINSKSAVDVRSSAAELGQLNAITIRSNAAKEAYGYQTDSASYKGQAELDKQQGKYAAQAGYIDAGTTLLGQGSAGKQSGLWDSYLSNTGM